MKAITCERCDAALKIDLKKGIAFCEYCGIAYLLDDALKRNAVEKWTDEMEQLMAIGEWDEAIKIGARLVDEVPTDYHALWLYYKALTHNMCTEKYEALGIYGYNTDNERTKLYHKTLISALKLMPQEEAARYEKEWLRYKETLNEVGVYPMPISKTEDGQYKGGFTSSLESIIKKRV